MTDSTSESTASPTRFILTALQTASAAGIFESVFLVVSANWSTRRFLSPCTARAGVGERPSSSRAGISRIISENSLISAAPDSKLKGSTESE